MDGVALTFDAAGSADPMVLNRIAWTNRWRDRRQSGRLANLAKRRASEAGSDASRKIAGLAHRTLAWQSRWNGRLYAAERQARCALELLEGTESEAAMADAETALAATYCGRGRAEEALRVLDSAMARLTDETPTDTRVDVLCRRAVALTDLGLREEARGVLRQAFGIAFWGEKALVQTSLARVHFASGDLDNALAWGLSSVASCKVWKNTVVLPYALGVLGAVHLRRGRLDRSRDCLEEGLHIARLENDRRAECRLLEQVGPLLVKEGKGAEGIRILRRARSMARQLDHVLGERRLCRLIAAACEEIGDTDGALRAYRKYATLCDGDAV